jgi:hypothetical protein
MNLMLVVLIKHQVLYCWFVTLAGVARTTVHHTTTTRCNGRLDAHLCSESVQGASLSLESVDDVKGSHSLSASVLRVGDSVTHNVLKEHLEHSTGLLVDQSGDTLHTSTASQTTNGWLGDSLDVVTQHLSVTLGATLSEAFTSLSTSGHVDICVCEWVKLL